MLESFKRLFAAKPDEPDYTEVGNWAQQHGYTLKRVRGESGFVIDGALDDKPWRLEWGSPQRDYIVGREFACAWSSSCRRTRRCCCSRVS